MPLSRGRGISDARGSESWGRMGGPDGVARKPSTEAERKKLSKILRKPMEKDLLDDIFEYESFLWGLGRMSLSKSRLSKLGH